ncbi:MAG: methyl-accepting chemotaxis protein [Gemmatimonadales bacterium]
MTRSWTFGQKIAGGFAAVVALAMLLSGIAAYALKTVVASKDRVIEVHAENLVNAEKLRAATERKGGAVRGYLLTAEEPFLDQARSARANFAAIIMHLKAAADSPENERLIEQMERAEADYQGALDGVISLRKSNAAIAAVSQAFETDVLPRREMLDQTVSSLAAFEHRLLDEGKKAATDTASSATTVVAIVSLVALILAAVIALVLTRTLSRQIGAAVQHVQSSSSELQAASNQQATGAKEQATAMNEITTTITELLATSKQIAESAQRVAHIAEETAEGARSGEQTVVKTTDSLGTIKRQVDLIVSHMLDLGKKSQQIGGILEIINELAEQTNILAINATIEAAGAGEAGKRFAVVADEIRKLADRVGGSTKEIRGLIEEIRAAVNTTVMTTEGGTKAVEAGARHFADVAEAFKQIVSLVSTTTEAAREIELSTKQQATAVEQVNLAVANVAQATRETEASSSQTFQTASQLTGLSLDLMRLIQPQTA